jgi:hypothetical protein
MINQTMSLNLIRRVLMAMIGQAQNDGGRICDGV